MKPRRDRSGRKAQMDLGPEAIFTVTLFAIVLVVIFVAFTNTGGFLDTVRQFFDKMFGNLEEKDYDKEVAIKSTHALVCAINSVVTGGKYTSDGCATYYGSSSLSLAESDTPGPGVVTPESPFAGVDSDSKQDKTDTSAASFICKSENECTVYNFRLPQKVTDAEEWITGFGDPRFLVFYKKFPVGEDAAWSGFSQWFQGAGTLVFSSMCASKLIYYGFTPVKTFKRIFNKEVPTYIAESSYKGIKSVKSAFTEFPATIKNYFDDYAYLARESSKVEVWNKRDVLTVLSSYTLKNAGSALKAVGEKSWSAFKAVAPRTAAYSADAAAGAVVFSDYDTYQNARVYTEFGKFFPDKGSIFLQEPLNREPLLDMEPQLKDKKASEDEIVDTVYPILTTKENGDYSPFYLASPCRSDLKVSIEEDLKCLTYSYNKITGDVYCDSPDETSWTSYGPGVEKCGSAGIFGTRFEDKFVSDVTNLVKNGMQKEVIFKDTDNDGIFDSMHEPIFGFTFELETNPANIVCCKNVQIGGETSYGWLSRDRCKDPLEIVTDEECERNAISIEKKRPVALINRLIDPTSIPWLADTSGVATWGCYNYTVEKKDNVIPTWSDYIFFGEGNELVKCSINNGIYGQQDSILEGLLEKNEELEDIFQTGTLWGLFSKSELADIEIVGNLNKDLKLENFNNIIISATLSDSFTSERGDTDDYIMFSDLNSDGKLDGIKTHVLHSWWKTLENIDKVMPSRSFVDTNADGVVDSVEGTRCTVDAITITPDKSRYSTEENNFCYTNERRYVGVALTISSFAIDAFVKKIPSPLTWALGTATDCLLAYYGEDLTSPDWPKG